MSNKQNYNTVKVEIPVEGEYILSILEYMLVVKCIHGNIYQYSEFTNISDKYIMTSVNCNTGNVMRIMEEFCKSHNCPKRILREELEKAEKNIKKTSDIDIKTYEETISIYKNTIETYNRVILGYSDIVSDLEVKIKDIYNKLSSFKLLLNNHTDILSGKNDNEIHLTNMHNKKSDDTVVMYEKIKEFMDSHSKRKDGSKSLINKFYTEFSKTISDEDFDISYEVFVDYLKDVYRNNDSIKIEGELISNIIFCSDASIKMKDTRPSTTKMINKSERAVTGNPRKPYKPRSSHCCSTRINNEDGKRMLDMWKTMTAKEIANKFPTYTYTQISSYCRKHSDFSKSGVTKEVIERLKSYNGTKTLRELRKIYDDPNLKRLCKNHNIPYKEE